MKEELLNKVREAIREPIVGNYLFDADELEKIYNEAAIYLQSFSGKNEDKDAIVFVALVNMTKEWKSEEDTFLDFIYRKFSSNYGLYQVIYSNLRTTIVSLFESKSIYMIEWGKDFMLPFAVMLWLLSVLQNRFLICAGKYIVMT